MPHLSRTLCLFCALLALSAPALAHEQPQERGLIAQMGEHDVHIMLTYRQPAGELTALTMARFDVNKDGQLDAQEAEFAGQSWLPRALHGLTFEVVGHAPRAHRPQIKFRRHEDGAMEMAALVRYELTNTVPHTARMLRITLADHALKTAARLHAQSPGVSLAQVLLSERALATPPGESLAGPYTLRAGQTMQARFALATPRPAAQP